MSRWRPSVTVAAVIERDGKFLFVEEIAGGRRVLNQPAGHLDPGESLVQAVAREVLEETAHRFTPTALLGIYRWLYDREDVTFLRFAFLGRVDGPEPGRNLDKEIVAALWLAPTELAARRAEHRSPLVQQCVDDFLAGRSFPLDVLSKPYG
ncbi:MAG: NUDIX hydrolase [Betaproteobacteria bacterium]|nr:NUDIX hydrolase [Betaproteobacteria bacterium]MDH5220968.1 NUDIX hydrolase [Betaproteobacteria bacterium]MDH5350273.1 NUDIX hydrolase [Betaproteobacteria bacterium]